MLLLQLGLNIFENMSKKKFNFFFPYELKCEFSKNVVEGQLIQAWLGLQRQADAQPITGRVLAIMESGRLKTHYDTNPNRIFENRIVLENPRKKEMEIREGMNFYNFISFHFRFFSYGARTFIIPRLLNVHPSGCLKSWI